jgi:hypothetical protein
MWDSIVCITNKRTRPFHDLDVPAPILVKRIPAATGCSARSQQAEDGKRRRNGSPRDMAGKSCEARAAARLHALVPGSACPGP